MSQAKVDLAGLRESFKAQTTAVQSAIASLVECQDFFKELKMNSESLFQVFAMQRQNLLQGMQSDDFDQVSFASLDGDSPPASGPASAGPTSMDAIKMEQLQRQVEALKLQNKKLEAATASSSASREVEWLTEENRKLKARVAELIGKSQGASDEGAELQQRAAELEREAESLRRKLDEAVSARERLEREVGANAEQGRSEATQLAAEVSEQRRKAEDLGSKVEALQRQVQDLTGERDTLRARARELEESQGRELADLRSRAETAEREAAEARSDRDAGAAREKKNSLQLRMKQAVGVAIMDELAARCLADNFRQMAEGVRAQLEQELTTDVLRSLTAALSQVVQHVAMGESAKWRELYGHEHRARKRIHDELMELKGNIRVFCRTRPMDQRLETLEGHSVAVQVVNDMTLRAGEKGQAMRSFDFDCVFGPDSTQEQVFEEVQHLVTSVLDGFNVCIMAYGQTGSGKTHTMEGPPENPGVNLRALERLFEVRSAFARPLARFHATRLHCRVTRHVAAPQVRAARRGAKEIAIFASAIEIYNEAVRDLLSKDPQRKLEIKQGADGMFVQDLVRVPVESKDDVLALMARAKGNRATFSTNMNEHSSRSHSILTVYIEAKDQSTGEQTRSKLHLVDLAGSERLSKTGATGDRLLEAQAINKSLSALGNVIERLQQKQQHIPYRDSRLTFLLQDSLGGNSKTLMIMAVSPSSFNAQETLCTLKFGQRAMKVDLGKATKRRTAHDVELTSDAAVRGEAASGADCCLEL